MALTDAASPPAAHAATTTRPIRIGCCVPWFRLLCPMLIRLLVWSSPGCTGDTGRGIDVEPRYSTQVSPALPTRRRGHQFPIPWSPPVVGRVPPERTGQPPGLFGREQG